MMRFSLRRAGAIALLALLISPMAVIAQDAPVVIAGSGVVAPVFQALAESAGVADSVDVQVTGTNAGLQALCSGSAQVALATRALTVEEEAACNAAGITFYEVLAGHNVAAFVTSAGADAPQCLTITELSTAFAPSAEGQVQNWNQVNSVFADQALTFYGPSVDSAGYALADRLIDGVGLRGDLQPLEDITALEPGAVAIVSLAEAEAASDAVQILNVDSLDGTSCATPSNTTVENRTYPAAESLYAYVAADAVANEAVTTLLNTLTGEEGATLITEAGFTPATADAYATVAAAIADGTTGRQFSVDTGDFQISETLAGAISLGGSPTIVQYITDLTTEFTTQYPAITSQTRFVGSSNGVSQVCAGTLDIAVIDTELSAEDLADCPPTEQINLGAEAVVLVASAGADDLSCLSPDQIATTWQASAEPGPTTWDQVSADFADTPVYLFAPGEGSRAADIMMIETTGTAQPIRSDVTETNSDFLYRAAAVANAGSGLTLLSWPEYQSVINNGQEGIQLVSVDVDGSCIEPSLSTIRDGSYPLARPVSLLVTQSALARPEIQALLWTTLLDENYGLLQLADLVGIEFGDLPAARSALQEQFAAANDAAAQPAPEVEATEEATAEPEAEVTEEAGAEATAEATETE